MNKSYINNIHYLENPCNTVKYIDNIVYYVYNNYGNPKEVFDMRFKRLVILDKIVLAQHQWGALREIAEKVVEFSGLNLEQVIAKLIKEQGLDPGAVCFTALAKEETTIRELNERLSGADAIISCWTNIPDEVLRENPQVKYIGFWTNLVQHRINLDLAKEMGITITYIPDYGTIAVAEYTIALLLELMRNVAKQADDTVRGKWPYELLKTSLYVPSIDEIPYRTLCGKKIGIIGFGRIGKQVAQIAQGFGMKISYFSKTRKPEWEARDVQFQELDDILRSADIVTLHMSPYASLDPFGKISLDDHAPVSEALLTKNKPIISKEKLALIRDGAIFINTSAGRLVDESALLDEAESGRIRVAVDVYLSNPDRKRIKRIVQTFGKGKNIFTYRGGWLTYESVLFKGDW